MKEENMFFVAKWRDGEPQSPYNEEWFIAETVFGDKTVLRALPEEYSYDYETADGTYFMGNRIKRWMQFPDGDFYSPDNGLYIDEILSIIDEEPEYPGELPDDLYARISDAVKSSDIELIIAALRATVHITKKNIINRICEKYVKTSA